MKKFFSYLDEYFEESIILTLLSLLIINVLVEVFRRYVLNNSGQYSEEIARYTLIAIIYLGVPYAVKKRCHIICDVLPSTISPKLNFAVTLVSNLLFMLMCVLMTLSCYQLVQQQIMLNKLTPAMYLPMWMFSSIVGIGFFIAIFRIIQSIMEDIKYYPNPVPTNSHASTEVDLDGSL